MNVKEHPLEEGLSLYLPETKDESFAKVISEIHTLILDFDGTLYNNKEGKGKDYEQEGVRNANQKLAEKNTISPKEVEEIMRHHKEQAKKEGRPTGDSFAVIEAGLANKEEWDTIRSHPEWRNPLPYLEKDPQLQKLLQNLQEFYTLIVASNSPTIAVRRGLSALGIDFIEVYGSDRSSIPKPHPDFFTELLTHLGAPHGQQMLSIGDRIQVDIIPALQSGVRAGVHVGGPAQVKNLFERLQK